MNYFGSGIRAHEDVNIEKLTLKVDVKKDDITDEYGNGKFSEAIRANDTLTIENGATVNVNSVSGTGPIYSENGDLVINDATVNVTSLAGIELSDGSKLGVNPIMSASGDVIISGNSNVTAKGYFGICGNNIQISGSAVVDSTSTDDCGFWVPTGKMTITDNAQVTASGYYPGINSMGGVEITGGTVKAYSEANYAIYSWKDLIISNSIVEAVTGDPEFDSIGASDNINVSNSWFTSNSGAHSVNFSNSVEITDGSGQVFGDAVLPGDATVPQGQVLVIREGESLTIPNGVTLTNYGTIQILGGSFTNNGTYIDYGETLGEIQGSGELPNYWFVTVKYGSGAADKVYNVVKGKAFTLPDAPGNSGYIFLGWRCGDVTYKAGEAVDIISDTTFTAVWGNLPDFPFYDVNIRDWYYDAVYYVWDKGLMDGVDTHEFAPNATLTRAMVWTIIARAEGVDTTGGNSWYAKAQEWVVANGVSDGEHPSAAITRQELVTMLYRYAQLKGYDVNIGEETNILSYVDFDSISEYAISAFQWACGIGLIEGDENGAVTPTATATRAQAAAIFMRYLES